MQSTNAQHKRTKATHPKKHEYPKHLHRKPDQRPPHQNQQHARPERQRAFPLVPAREEHECPLGPEEERDADEEEDVAHGEQGAVEEQDQAEDEEEAAAAAEGDADFCRKRAVSIVWLYGRVFVLVLFFSGLLLGWDWDWDVLCESESHIVGMVGGR